MKRALPAVAAAALLVALTGATTTAQAATQHCEGYKTEVKVEVPQGATGTTQVVTVGGQQITVTVDGDEVTFTDAAGNPVSGTFCLKAGTVATNGSGTSGSTGGAYGTGKDISYVVLYGVGIVSPPS